MHPALAEFTSPEDRLRAHDELLMRLSDALPVGTFQIDRECRILFTNGRLHHILGGIPAGDIASPFMTHVWQVPVAGGPLAIDPSDLQVVQAAIMARQQGLAPTTTGTLPA